MKKTNKIEFIRFNKIKFFFSSWLKGAFLFYWTTLFLHWNTIDWGTIFLCKPCYRIFTRLDTSKLYDISSLAMQKKVNDKNWHETWSFSLKLPILTKWNTINKVMYCIEPTILFPLPWLIYRQKFTYFLSSLSPNSKLQPLRLLHCLWFNGITCNGRKKTEDHVKIKFQNRFLCVAQQESNQILPFSMSTKKNEVSKQRGQ